MENKLDIDDLFNALKPEEVKEATIELLRVIKTLVERAKDDDDKEFLWALDIVIHNLSSDHFDVVSLQ